MSTENHSLFSKINQQSSIGNDYFYQTISPKSTWNLYYFTDKKKIPRYVDICEWHATDDFYVKMFQFRRYIIVR